MGTIQETGIKFVMQIDEAFKKFGLLEKSFDNLPLAAEKATNKMNNSFDESMTSIKQFDDLLSKSGKDFDTKAVQSELQKAQKEFTETGNVNKETMQSLQKEIKNVDWKSLDVESRQTFKNVISNVNSVERNMKKLEDVKFLESLPEDARNAGKQLLLLEKDVDSASKKIKSMDDGVDFSKFKSELDTAKREIRETGTISETTMKEINNDINGVQFDKLGNEAQQAHKDIKSSFNGISNEIDAINKKGTTAGSGLADGINDADKNVGLFKGSLGGLAGTIATAFAAGTVVNFTKSLVEATAEVKALNSQYEQVMGDMKGSTDKYLGEIAQKYNVHPNELKKSMLQYQAILKSKGLSEKDAFDTSKKWLERTVDASSFANESMEESTARVMGIIKGEYDSADTIMINMSQTMLNSIAEVEYGKKWEKLTEKQQEYIKVSQALKQHQESGVMGQGIKEADSYEKNLARLKNTWTDFLASYGGPALEVVNNSLKGGIKIIEGLAKGFSTIGKLIRDLTGGKQVNILQKLGFSNGEANNIINWFNTLKKQLSLASRAVGDFIKDGLGQIKSFFSGPDGQQLLQAVKNIFGAIATVVKVTFPIIKFIVKSVWDNIVGVIRGGMQVIKGIIQVFSGLFTGDFKKMWEGIKNIFFGAINLIWNGVQLLFYGKLLKGALGFAKLFAGGLKSMWGNILNFFKSFGSSLWKNTSLIFTNIWKSVSKIFENLVKWLINSAKNMANSVGNWFKNLWTNSVKFLKSMSGGLSKIWSSIKSTAYNAGKYLFDKVTGFFKSLYNSSLKLITNLKNGLFNSWKSIKQHAYDAGKYIKDKIVGFIKDTWTGVQKWIGSIKSGFTNLKDDVVKKVRDMANGMSEKVTVGLNVMVDGVNWIADKLGMGKPLSPVTPKKYSTGTGEGHPEDGWATVGDKGPGNGKGTREIVEFPNGRTTLFEKETTFWMPKGTKVYNNQQTEQILNPAKYSTGNVENGNLGDDGKKKGNIITNAMSKIVGKAASNYVKKRGAENTMKDIKTAAKAGEVVEDVHEYMDDPGKLLNIALSKFGLNLDAVKGIPGQLFGKAFSKLKSGAIKKITEWFEESGGEGDGSSFTSFRITTPYSPNARPPGYPHNAHHYGIDYATPQGHPITAPTSGTLTHAMDSRGGLTGILLSKKFRQYFMHMESLRKDGPIKKGAFLGKTGGDPRVQPQSGIWSNGPHLHYQVKREDGSHSWNTSTMNPADFLKGVGYGKGSGINTSKFSGTVGNLRGTVAKALSMSGLPTSAAYVNAWLRQVQTESGGRANAVGGDDGLADGKAMGLVQVKPGTFRANALPGHNNIFNPLDNLIAGMRYAKVRYGGNMLSVIGQGHGYANGGIITKHHIAEVGEEGPETIIPHDPKRKARANYLLEKTDRIVNPEKYSNGNVKTHKVKYGDTLWDIANKNKTTVKFLQALNNIKNHLIYPGQIIKLTKVVESVGKNIKKHADTIKESVTKKVTKPQYKTVKASRTDDLLKVATDLIAKANSNPDGKFYKENTALGKYITDKMKNVNTQALNSLYTNIKAIIKKIDDTIKGNQTKVTKGKSSIVSLSDKNRDANYKLEQLYEEKKLNGATGYINVKTRLADGDTTAINKQIASQKQRIARSKKMIDDFYKKQAQANIKYRNAKTKLDKAKAKVEMSNAQERVSAWKKQNEKELAQLKKFEQEKFNLQNRYKVTQKKVKGRSAKAIDNDIKKQKDLIAKNKKLIATTKSESKLFNSQIKSLQALKKNEVLRADFIKKLYKQREALIEKLKVLKEKEAALKEAKVSYKEGIVDNLQGYAGFGAAKGNTARDFVEFMKYRLGRVRKFSANMTKLKEWGLDPQILQEMIAGGIESAMPKAEVLIAGGKGYISQINALQAEVNKAVEWIANKQTNNVFDSQIASVQAEIKSNQAQQNALNQQSRDYMTKKTTKKVAVTTPKKPATVVGSAKKYVTKTVNKDYKVQKGDTLSSIAKKYGVTVEQLKKLNNLTSNTIKTNQVIKVPVKVQVEVDDKGVTTKKTTKTTTKTHAIKWGDTLGGIAKKYGTTVDELKKYNGLKSDTIIAGRTLKIPIKTEVVEIVSTKTVKKATPTTSNTVSKASTVAQKVTSYIVKAGDSLGLIAQKYKTTVAKIKSLNGLKSDLIHPKQKLKIPGYASGGIIDIPQIAWIAEGGFAESIISHDPSKRVQQQRIWKETGDRLGFDNNEAILREIYGVLVDSRNIQDDFKNRPNVTHINPRDLGKATAPFVQDEIVRQQLLANRGLANGR
ncbi:LysM peptidoglycan-binding domain-containing protein [Macrococcoides goetzii]|nr:LysM peptidoglycan-binding domain-containing protein [Macrococcus goetzii]TDM50004.1 LysM peptidoglycan-binding domain-containing protein [Macrococcus goetzii]